jgi:hypothetical protein
MIENAAEPIQPMIRLYVPLDDVRLNKDIQPSGLATVVAGPKLPQMQLMEEMQYFRRVQLYELSEPIRDMDDANDRIAVDSTDSNANAYIGLRLLQRAEETEDNEDFQLAKTHLKTAVHSGTVLKPEQSIQIRERQTRTDCSA